MSDRPDDGVSDYEALLIREDRRGQYGVIALAAGVSLTLSSFFEVWAAFWHVGPFLPVVALADLWNGRSLVRTGYAPRGKAMQGRAWRYVCAFVLLLAVTWVQARFGLWFAQRDFPSRYG